MGLDQAERGWGCGPMLMLRAQGWPNAQAERGWDWATNAQAERAGWGPNAQAERGRGWGPMLRLRGGGAGAQCSG